ncbi:MAG: phosphoribosylamine--glycine ligase [Oscillospiraceae bacterium]|jgi:phosphoribosylamine--glycine ligase|nr:phosphoribosylamine--glycine ligase [Oscillospiraceae bacterium]
MDILVVGGGGREHAVVRKLSMSQRVGKVYCAPGNAGIAALAECFDVAATDMEGMVALAKKLEVDCVFVAPDDPLVMGMVDRMNAEGIRAFGPSKAAAIIEGSKVFSKEFMKKHSIPSAKYEVFDSSAKAVEYVKLQNSYPVVIKADGLALGKGVIIAESFEDAEKGILSIMEDKVFGESGNNIVIEEFLTGPEVSVLSFTDGKTVRPMLSSMDHKRALDGNRGLNTGGMGVIAPNPYFTEELADRCMEEIFLPTVKNMAKEGRKFKGCLYFGLMLTENGPKVIEYNCRFGDPEAQAVLHMLDSDFIDIIDAVIDERLSDIDISWREGASACVIMASGGYPEKYAKGVEISGLDEDGQLEGVTVYHAGTAFKDGKTVTNGGRVLGVTAEGATLSEALKKAYEGVSAIEFDKAHYRTDIGRSAMDIVDR